MLFVPTNSELKEKNFFSRATRIGCLIGLWFSIKAHRTRFSKFIFLRLEWVDSPISPGTAKPIIIQLDNYKVGSLFNLLSRFKGHSIDNISSSNHSLKFIYNNVNGIQIGQTQNWWKWI